MSAVAHPHEPVRLDVSALPTVAFGKRSPIWWGVVLFCAIEGMTLALMYFSYLYIRGNYDVWPPSGSMNPLPIILETVTLLASLVPMWFCRKAALDMDLKRSRMWLALGTVISVLAVPIRVWWIASMPFLWDENAYASVVWTSIGFHCVEGAAGVLENVFLTILLFRGPVEKKHFEDLEVNVLFWAFVVLVWMPFTLTFMTDGVLR